jgi:hypothetical protein
VYPIRLKGQHATPEILAQLEARGWLRRLRPSDRARAVPPGEQVVETVELAAEGTGPWQMLAVACNRSKLTYLAMHSDAECWLFFADPASKPLLYIVATCSAEEFQAKAESGRLSAADFFVLQMRPNDPQTSYFTVPGGVLHDELTLPGPLPAPIFFVPEPSRMEHTRVPLAELEIEIEPA